MSILKWVSIPVVLVPVLALGADPSASLPSPQVRAELTELVEAWIDAEVEDDREALERILHEDFLSTFASGLTLDRTAYIDFILGLDIAPFTVTNEVIRIHDETAVVIDVSEDGETKFTWIAVKHGGQWRVISQTFSKVE